MGMMIKGEGDSSIPSSLQDRVLEPTFFSTVVPLGEVRSAVRPLWRRPDLMSIHTATTLESAIQNVCRWQGPKALHDCRFSSLRACNLLYFIKCNGLEKPIHGAPQNYMLRGWEEENKQTRHSPRQRD